MARCTARSRHGGGIEKWAKPLRGSRGGLTWANLDALPKVPPGDADAVVRAIRQALAGPADAGLRDRCERLERRLAAIEDRLSDVPTRSVPLQTLGPGPLELARPILVTLAPMGDEVEAGWIEANLYTGGETDHEALTNLASLISDVYGMLDALGEGEMGPPVLRQRALLQGFVRRRS
jgi:hypothetical protein